MPQTHTDQPLHSAPMSLPADLALRVAGPDDLPAIAMLRAAVGWPAHEWALRAAIQAPHARCWVAMDADAAVAAVGSGIAFGRLGFVGNMIVGEEHRRRGIGATILDTVTTFLENAGCQRLELFATDDGRPLYARHGFELTDPSVTARVPRSTALHEESGVSFDETTGVGELTAYDTPRFGGDRLPLLEMMLSDPDRPMLVARLDGAVAGYAWLRTDGPRVGPLVADTPAVAGQLLAEAFRRAPQTDELSLNLPAANVAGARWLHELGLETVEWKGRMARGPEIPRRDDTIYANLVGALG